MNGNAVESSLGAAVAGEGPCCLLCGERTRLLYASNVPPGAPIDERELACTSPLLSIHDDIFWCRSCRLARSQPPLAARELEDLYRDVEDEAYLASEDERRHAFRESLERLRALGCAPPARVLEIGSAAGLFLDEARRAGWDAVGIEPSRWGAEAARSFGAKVHNGTLDEFVAEPASFDAIVSWDVLEHLDDPLRALERAHELLKPGGRLIVTTINIGGLGARMLRGRWPWLMRMHLHYFTRQSLAAVVTRAGFEIQSLATEPKTLKLGYVLDRARGFLGAPAGAARAVAGWLRLGARPVRIDLGDILRVEARKPD